MHAHARASVWWPKAKRLELRHMHTVEEACEVERELIEQWEPEFNTVHNSKQKDRERANSGLLTAEGLSQEMGIPLSLAKHLMTRCPTVVFGQKKYVARAEVQAWLDENMVVIPPEAR
jgi:hypothetical protein